MVAVVNDQVVTLSDIQRLAAIGVLAVPGQPSGEEWVAAAAHALVDRRVVLDEIDRFGGPEPAPAAVEREVQALERRFGPPETFAAARARTQMTQVEIVAAVRDSLRVQMYIDQRFSLRVEPTDRDIADYYRDHASELRRVGQVPPLIAIEPEIRRRVADAKRRSLIDAWIEELHHRARVTFLTFRADSAPRSTVPPK